MTSGPRTSDERPVGHVRAGGVGARRSSEGRRGGPADCGGSECVGRGPWEVAIKAAAGKLRIGEPPAQWFSGLLERYELREVPLDAHVASAAAALPAIHRDPFDRVLVALARADMLTILTADQVIPKYPGVKTLW
jgi:hypothetical protein